MKKMTLEICCGTACYTMGANRLLNIENEMPIELRGKADIKASPCLGLCYNKELKGAPYVKLNGMIIEKATAEKIFERMKELLDS